MKHQSGSIVTYILIAIFLSGLLVAILTQGPKKNVDTTYLDKTALFLKTDLEIVHTLASECAQSYNTPVDVDGDGDADASDNPNPPFPLYDDLSSGGTGEDFLKIRCPGAPASQQAIFKTIGDARLKFFTDTENYTTLYMNDAVEGVYLRVTSNESDAMWEEIIARVEQKLAACSATIVKAAGDCVNGCLYYWIARQPTSVIGAEAGCP